MINIGLFSFSTVHFDFSLKSKRCTQKRKIGVHKRHKTKIKFNKVSYRKQIARQHTCRPRESFLHIYSLTTVQNLVAVSRTVCAHGMEEVPKSRWGATPLGRGRG